MKSVKKILILPNISQKFQIDFWIRRCLYLYNVALEEKIGYYKVKKKYLSPYDQKKELVEIKKYDPSWKEVPNKSLTEAIFRLDIAFKNFFKRPDNGFPKFKNKNNYNSVYFIREDVRVIDGDLYLPKIKTKIKHKETLPNKYSSVMLIRENNKYYLCFCVDIDVIEKPININKIIGIDLGLKTLITTNEGDKIDRMSLKLYNKYQKRIKELNISLSRKVKGSNKWKKVKRLLNVTHKKLANTRKDFLHKVSTEYIKNNLNNRIIIGDINVNSIIANSYNMKIGTNKSKKGLRRNFYNASLSELKEMFKYKGIKFGCNVEFVTERNTSKTCSCCHHVKEDLKLSDRVFVCEYCKTSIDRDVNAAINIRDVWLGQFESIRDSDSYEIYSHIEKHEYI